MPQPQIDPGHEDTRNVLRAAGPALIVIGGVLTLVGVIDFFSAFGGMHPPTLFWCAFLGLPILSGGFALTKFAYMGKIARYMSQEITPAATDTFNYAAGQTKDGIRQVTEAIVEGISGAGIAAAHSCGRCGHRNEADARFCAKCGQAIGQKRCPSCGGTSPADARFCDDCGRAL